jgi:hypothetical protein
MPHFKTQIASNGSINTPAPKFIKANNPALSETLMRI